MVSHTDTLTAAHLERRCVACGYSGSELDQPPSSCPSCSCDFTQRPPRTYAEMEGLGGLPADRPLPPLRWHELIEETRLAAIQRWLAATFLSVLVLVSLLFVLILVVTAE